MLPRPLIAFAAIALATPAFAQVAPGSAGPGVRLGMRERNNSGQVGVVMLVPHGTKETLVILEIANTNGNTEAAHVHRGRLQASQENSCDNLDPKPAYVLHPVVNGSSKTLVKASEATLLSGNYVVNVHAENDLAHYVACGELYQ